MASRPNRARPLASCFIGECRRRRRQKLRHAAGAIGRWRRWTRSVRHRLEHPAVKGLIAIVRVLPDTLVRGLGTMLGVAFYTLDRAHRRIAQRNLATAFPARTPRERRAIARRAFTHFGRLLLELLKFSTLSLEAMMSRVEFEGE